MNKLNIIKTKAKKLNLKGDIKKSNKKNKKYDYILNDKIISFGDNRYEDFLDHKDLKRRENYKKRHSNIYNKKGQKSINIKESPAYLSYNLLW